MRLRKPAAPPIDPAVDFERSLREFAREVARRHRGRPVNPGSMLAALRGYHCARSLVTATPALDEGLLALAVEEYLATRGVRRPVAA